ncbi:MAG TPA: hypothetical protein PKZ24_03505 [Nitrospirales bacterium]|nr:hypothetical protein [Nitrospirales bacterium]
MNRTRRLSLVLVGVFTLLSSVPIDSRAQDGGQAACGCSEQDKLDVINRINQVKAAMKEYDALISEWEKREKGTGEPLLLNATQRKIVQGSIGFRMAGAGDPHARSFGAGTNAACEVTIDPNATSCLRGALEDHEAVHQKICESQKGKASIFDLAGQIDWRVNQRIVDYMKEEKTGYQKELERLTEERQKQEKNCKKLTKLDLSMQRQLQQMFAQRERLQSANNRLENFGKSLN